MTNPGSEEGSPLERLLHHACLGHTWNPPRKLSFGPLALPSRAVGPHSAWHRIKVCYKVPQWCRETGRCVGKGPGKSFVSLLDLAGMKGGGGSVSGGEEGGVPRAAAAVEKLLANEIGVRMVW